MTPARQEEMARQVARLTCHHQAELDDCIQEARIAIWEALKRRRDGSGGATYAWSHARGRVLHWMRDRSTAVRVPPRWWEAGDRVKIVPLKDWHIVLDMPTIDEMEVKLAVDALPEPDRYILRRYYWSGWPDYAIGASIGLHESSVWNRRQRALKRLKQRYRMAAISLRMTSEAFSARGGITYG